jgi:hypothetical protein
MPTPLSLRTNDQERGLLEAYAQSAGVGVCTYARQVLRDHVGLDSGVRNERVAKVERRVERIEMRLGMTPEP